MDMTRTEYRAVFATWMIAVACMIWMM